jgi:hypothetical protein
MAYILPSLLLSDDFDMRSFHLLTMFLQSLDTFATFTCGRALGSPLPAGDGEKKCSIARSCLGEDAGELPLRSSPFGPTQAVYGRIRRRAAKLAKRLASVLSSRLTWEMENFRQRASLRQVQLSE